MSFQQLPFSIKGPLQNSFFGHLTLTSYSLPLSWCWLKLIKYFIFRLSSQYQKSLDEVNETFQFYVSMLEERKAEVVRDLEQAYSGKQVQLSVYSQKAQDTVEKILQVLPVLATLQSCSLQQRLFSLTLPEMLQKMQCTNYPLNIL